LQPVCVTEIYHHIKYKENLEAWVFGVYKVSIWNNPKINWSGSKLAKG